MRIGEKLVEQGQWGGRAQIGGTVAALRDLQGNRDGIWGNEDKAAGTTPGTFGRNAWVTKIGAAVRTGVSAQDEIATLSAFRAKAEAQWGAKTMDPAIEARLRDGALFAVQKAIALKGLDRHPSTVVDGFVSARGKVDGAAIAPREVFVQHWKPTGEPTGKVIVVAPGYLESGRNFQSQIVAWNRAGHDVVVMDQQWAGQTTGTPGQVDRGFGIARDVASVTAYAHELGRRLYGDRLTVGITGNSMGGFGALAAYTLNRAGRIDLEGAPMPKEPRLVLTDAYLGPTPGFLNNMLSLFSKIPILNRIQVPLLEGLPELSSNRTVETFIAQGGTLENVKAQLVAFSAVTEDIATVRKLTAEGAPPAHPITFVHAKNDPLAHAMPIRELAASLGKNARLVEVDSRDHVLEQHPNYGKVGVEAMNRALI